MVRTRHPPLLLIHPPLPLHHLRQVDFTRKYSLVERNVLSTRIAQSGISKDPDVRRGHQGERSGESTGLKWVMTASKRDLNRTLFSAGEPLRSPQPGLGSRNSETLVVHIELARPPQPRDTRSTGMRSAQIASGRVRSGTCPGTGVSTPPCK